WIRPNAFKCCALKLWMPMDKRLTPLARYDLNLSASKVPGFASIVTSTPGSNGIKVRISDNKRSRPAADSRLGVPPPMKIVCSLRPQINGKAISRSVRKAERYASSGISPPASCELKSQYGHLRTHQGMCTYSDNGGKAANANVPGCKYAAATRAESA